jgi:hypothetical protein
MARPVPRYHQRLPHLHSGMLCTVLTSLIPC